MHHKLDIHPVPEDVLYVNELSLAVKVPCLSSHEPQTTPGVIRSAVVAYVGFLLCSQRRFFIERDSSFFGEKSLSSYQERFSYESKTKAHNCTSQRTIMSFSDATDGGRTRTLSPERDFKSLVSANFTTVAYKPGLQSPVATYHYVEPGIAGMR